MLTVKYMAPTNTRGARVKVQGHGESVTVAWDHALDPTENACAAVKAHRISPDVRRAPMTTDGGTWVVHSAADSLPVGWVAVLVSHHGPLRVLTAAAFQDQLEELHAEVDAAGRTMDAVRAAREGGAA